MKTISISMLRHIKMKRMSLIIISLAFAGVAAVPALPAAAAPPTLTNVAAYAENDPNNPVAVMMTACPARPTPEASASGGFDMSYTADVSTIDGSTYPGRYTEAGTFTVGTQPISGDGGSYYVTAYTANFTLISGDTTIKGTKQLQTARPVGSTSGYCIDNQEAAQVVGGYTATIRTADGTKYTDRGLVSTYVHQYNFQPYGQFSSVFDSDQDTTSPVGHVFGAGNYSDQATFKVNARNNKKGTNTNCTIKDKAPKPNVVIKCTDGATYNRSGNTATLTGNATINSQPTTYTMYLTDNPGGIDDFSIQTASGYSGSGTVTNGDITFLR